MKTQSNMDFLPLAVQGQFLCQDFNGEQKGKAQSCFYSKERFPPICCGWQRPLKRRLRPASPSVAEREKKQEQNCQANRQSVPCTLCLIAAAPSQGLNHTLLNSRGRPGNTEMPQSDSEHSHGFAPTLRIRSLSKPCVQPLTSPALSKTISFFIPKMAGNSLKFALSNHANTSPTPMQRPA